MEFVKLLFIFVIDLLVVNNLKALTIEDVIQIESVSAQAGDGSQISLVKSQIKLSLSEGKSNNITVLDVTKDGITSAFANTIKKNLDIIADTTVGKQLLIDIASFQCNELIILNTNLCDAILGKCTDTILEKFEGGDQSDFDKALLNGIATKIQEILGVTDGCRISFKDFLYNIRNYSCFFNKSATQYGKNIVVIGDLSESIIAFSHEHLNDIWIALQKDEDHNFDTGLFHEMNHYRHFKQNIGTYDDNGSLLETINGSLSSFGLNIRKSNKYYFPAKMSNAEEELQQLGCTLVTPDNELIDKVNESFYRIQRAQNIRFPYDTKYDFCSDTTYDTLSAGLSNIYHRVLGLEIDVSDMVTRLTF